MFSHAFSHGYHPRHTERLAAYWAEALGGPTTYSDEYGDETPVVRIHSGNGLHEEMDQWAITCFDKALEDVGLARDERLRRVLHDYFAWATTTTMSRFHHSAEDVPDALHIPKVVLGRTRRLSGKRDRFCGQFNQWLWKKGIVGLERLTYSYLKATIGSKRIARRAGM